MYRYANGGERYTIGNLPGSPEEAGLFDVGSSVMVYDEVARGGSGPRLPAAGSLSRQQRLADARGSASPARPPTTVPLMRMYCRSGPSSSSSRSAVSRPSQRATVPLTMRADLAAEVLGDVAHAGLDAVLDPGRQRRIRPAAAGRTPRSSRPAGGAAPSRGRPPGPAASALTSAHTVVTHARSSGWASSSCLSSSPRCAHRLGRLQLVDEAADPGVEVDPQLVVRGCAATSPSTLRAPSSSRSKMRSSAASGSHHGDSVREPGAQAGAVLGEEAVDGPQHDVEQVVVAAVLGHHAQRPARERGQRGGLDAAAGDVLERPVHLVVPEQVGGGHRGVGGVAGEPGGVVRLGQPGGQPGHDRGARTRSTMMSGVRKLVWTKSPSVSPNWSLRSTMIAVWGMGMRERVAEQGGDREPVGQAADHAGLDRGLERSRPRWRRRPTTGGRRTRRRRRRAGRSPGGGPGAAGARRSCSLAVWGRATVRDGRRRGIRRRRGHGAGVPRPPADRPSWAAM